MNSLFIGIDLGGWEKTIGVCILEENEKLHPISKYCSSCEIIFYSCLIKKIKSYLKNTRAIAIVILKLIF